MKGMHITKRNLAMVSDDTGLMLFRGEMVVIETNETPPNIVGIFGPATEHLSHFNAESSLAAFQKHDGKVTRETLLAIIRTQETVVRNLRDELSKMVTYLSANANGLRGCIAEAEEVADVVVKPTVKQCSVCKDDPAECSKTYSGGWIGTPCPMP